MDNELGLFWGKTDRKDQERWNPLMLHLVDVAAAVEAILSREPFSTRQRMAEVFDLSWDEAMPWILFLAACHDLGKACPGFQCREYAPSHIRELELKIPVGVKYDVHHAFVSQIALKEFLITKDWSFDLASHIADAVGCHHGERCSSVKLGNLEGCRKSLGDTDWENVRIEICDVLFDLFKPTVIPTKSELSGPDFMLISGLFSFADWIGSNEDYFPFGDLEDTRDLAKWLGASRKKAEFALDSIGWNSREPLAKTEATFEEVFKQSPRPLQEAIAKAVKEISKPSIILVEAPMGEGKTEAAFFAHLELQRTLKHRGLYIALPTKATGNAMFKRTVKFLKSQDLERHLDLQLLHGSTLLNNDFQEIRLASIYGSNNEGNIHAGEWFTHKKRALLSEYGVGTIDQALLGILPVRHQFVRLWGLANRVVVFDEIHAYDTYTGTLLIELLRWLLALNSSVILLSATLPPKFKRELAKVVDASLDQEVPYPRLSILSAGSLTQVPFHADLTRQCQITIEGISSEIEALKQSIELKLKNGGMGLILVNTVDRAQKIYQLFNEGVPLESDDGLVGKRLSDGTEIILFHARFPADRRQAREDYVLSAFGVSSKREGRKILIATQVVEQSLDLDFDCIITDLAPIDLILQRAGRLWRHRRPSRPISQPILLIAGLINEIPCGFGAPLWWNAVYRENLLLSTWVLLKSKSTLLIPDEIDDLVKSVYEEEVIIPDALIERNNKAICDADGKICCHKQVARAATIGYPDGASWDDPNRFSKYDDDEPGLHRSLIAQTRLGEPSVIAIPIFPTETSYLKSFMTLDRAKLLYLRAVTLSRKGVVHDLQTAGIPDSWKQSSLLRNCYPLTLTESGCWENNPCVRLDVELGIVYESKEQK